MSKKRLSPELSKRIIKDLGGQSKTARLLGSHQPTVCLWTKKGIPYVYVMLLQSKYGFLPSVQETFLEKNYQ